MARTRRAVALSLAAWLAPTVAAGQERDVDVVAEVRVRSEWLEPAGAPEAEPFTLLRTRLGVRVAASEHALLFAQVQDSRAFGEELSTLADASADALDLHQGWLQLGGTVADGALAVRAGRQEIALGTERLVGPVGWSNTGRSFDAARVLFDAEDRAWQATGIVATVRERGTRFGGPAGGDDHTLLGVHWAAAGNELYVLHDRAADYRVFSGVDRTTLGGRGVLPLDRLEASLEAAWQTGDQLGLFDDILVDQDISAWFAGARLGLGVEAGPLRSVGVGLDWLSGDDAVTSDSYGAFNTLYATNHKFYGYIDLFLDPAARTGDRGLVDGILSASAVLGELGTLAADLHGFWLAEPRGLADRDLGWELDLTLPLRVADVGRLQLGYSFYLNGAAAPAIGLGPDGELWHWAYVQAAVAF